VNPRTLFLATALLTLSTAGNAATITFLTDPFAGSDALTTPGRQVVGGEPSVTFSTATDVYAFDPTIFGVSQLSVVNDVIGNVPATGVNVVVLRTFDNDANPATPFGAGNAANLIADQITSAGPGFFIYFNSGLNLPRLVYSTDLNVNTADLKILARMPNFTGLSGELVSFTSSNFVLTPEPSTWLLAISAGLFLAGSYRLRRGSRG
jgi:hypothetical protein